MEGGECDGNQQNTSTSEDSRSQIADLPMQKNSVCSILDSSWWLNGGHTGCFGYWLISWKTAWTFLGGGWNSLFLQIEYLHCQKPNWNAGIAAFTEKKKQKTNKLSPHPATQELCWLGQLTNSSSWARCKNPRTGGQNNSRKEIHNRKRECSQGFFFTLERLIEQLLEGLRATIPHSSQAAPHAQWQTPFHPHHPYSQPQYPQSQHPHPQP